MSTNGWQVERQAAAAALIAAGWTPEMVAGVLGCSAQTASTWARRDRQQPTTDPRTRRAIVLRLHERGWTFARIASRLGVSVRYVSKLAGWTRLADAGPAEDPPAAPAQADGAAAAVPPVAAETTVALADAAGDGADAAGVERAQGAA